MALRGPKIALNAPNVIKVAPKWPLNAPERIKTTPKCSEMTAIGPKSTPNPLKFMGFCQREEKSPNSTFLRNLSSKFWVDPLKIQVLTPKRTGIPPKSFGFGIKKLGKNLNFPFQRKRPPKKIEFQRSKKGGKPPKSAFFGNFSQSYQNHLEPPQFKRD